MRSKQRIFTRSIDVYGDFSTTGNTFFIAEWKAEEDMLLVGFQICAELSLANVNDGVVRATVTLSANGNMAAPDYDAMIARAVATRETNTAPAYGYYSPAHITVMFADGDAIPIREEGLLYFWSVCNGKTAGIDHLDASVKLYLIRGTSPKT